MTRARGFTLLELLAALVILSILGLLSYRGLAAVLDSREHVTRETSKWRAAAAFFERFERDVQAASAQPARGANAWDAKGAGRAHLRLELTRGGSFDGSEAPRRIAYALNDAGEVELWLWAGLDVSADSAPVRHRVLAGVRDLELEYLAGDGRWVSAWPVAGSARTVPLAVRVRVVLASGEDIVRVFALA